MDHFRIGVVLLYSAIQASGEIAGYQMCILAVFFTVVYAPLWWLYWNGLWVSIGLKTIGYLGLIGLLLIITVFIMAHVHIVIGIWRKT